MIAPRWRKVLADLWGNKVRSLLMIVTIGVGIFAVGFVAAVGDIAMNSMDADFRQANGHSGVIYAEPFGDDLVASLARVPGVAAVEGRSGVQVRAVVSEDNKPSLSVVSVPALADMRIDRLTPYNGAPMPPLGPHEVYLANASLGVLPARAGENLVVELPDGRRRSLRIAAIVHDVQAIPASFGAPVMAYADPATLEWLGGTRDFNQLYYTVTGQTTDKEHVTAVGQDLADKIRASGREVYSTVVYNPGRHFARDIFQAVEAVLGILGALSVLLSTFLIVNIINALLNQHIRFIGVMKAIGGRQGQIAGMYLALVLAFGLLAFGVMLWPAAAGGYQVAKGLGGWLDFVIEPFRFSPLALGLQAGIAVLVPALAAALPIWNGVRLTVREAISSYGLGQGHFGSSPLDRLLNRVRVFSRPARISLRNTFRRKTRLALTLSTLTLAGAIFIAVFNLWTAFDGVIAQVQGYFLADVNVQLAHNYRFDQIAALVQTVPGLKRVEGWSFVSGNLLSADKSSSIQIAFVAPPNDSQLIRPVLTSGRWLRPGDENAVVIGNHVLKEFPNLKVGDVIITKVDGREYNWTIVGLYRMAGNANPALIYANRDYLDRRLGQTGQAGSLRVVTAAAGPQAQDAVARRLEAVFKENRIQVADMTTGEVWRQQQAGQFDVLIYFLLVMALLIAAVGGLGLMGTMSMNVLERSREIGVLRAIGASNRAVLGLVLAEGLMIGVLSWALGLLVSVPITLALNAGVGAAILTIPLDFTFGVNGVLIWLGAVTVLAGLASALPAWNAMRLTVREVLSYE